MAFTTSGIVPDPASVMMIPMAMPIALVTLKVVR